MLQPSEKSGLAGKLQQRITCPAMLRLQRFSDHGTEKRLGNPEVGNSGPGMRAR